MVLLYVIILIIVLLIGIFGLLIYLKPERLYRGKNKEPPEKYIKGKKKHAIMLMVMCAVLLIYIIYVLISGA